MKCSKLFSRSFLVLPLFIFVLGLAPNYAQTILSYTNDTTGALNSVATNATGTPLTRVNGTAVPGTPCLTGFSTASFAATTTYTTTLSAVEVSATPNTGYALNVTGFSMDVRRSATGPAAVRFAYSTDGGGTWTDQGINQAPSVASCGVTTTASWVTTITVTAPASLKFRAYGFNASGTGGTFQILNLNINGTVTTTMTATCGVPASLVTSSVTTTTAILNWAAVTGAASYDIRYRQVGTLPWSAATSATNSVAISGLSPATTYEFQVQSVCSSADSSGYSGSANFVTSSIACALTTSLSATSITTTTAILNWATVSGAATYDIRYRQTGTLPWSSTTSATNSVAISGLLPATTYEFQVQTMCSATDSSGYTGSADFTTTSIPCVLTTSLSATSITATTATLNWTTVAGAASYEVRYRQTGTTPWTITTSATNSVAISGLLPATTYEFQVQTMCSSTDSSGYTASDDFTTLSATTSGSSGRMAIYFNNPVNNTVSTGVNAVYLHNAFADTIVAYISRAHYSIDIAQYDYNQSSSYANIATAVNAAHASGVKVRWIYDGSSPNTGISLLSPGIHTLASPTSSAYNIMHNKFIIIDANSPNPNDAIVSTGSEDWSTTQFNQDFNNLLFIQDSALANAYTNEFNQMWGDTGIAPNTTLSKFGPFKTDLGQHLFTIGGRTVELYFSPSDGTDNHIQSSINSANTDLYFGVYEFTEHTDATDIVARQTAGVYVAGIVDQYTSTSPGSAYPVLTSGLGSNMITYSSPSLIYHNKMMIVDPSNTCSDPQVLTGSHNWTTSANSQNDENTLIIHNDTVANIYYQSFYANYTGLGGTLTAIAPCSITTCGSSGGLPATNITTTSVLLNWTAVSGATSYTIQYRQTGTSTWSNTTSPTNSVAISGLTPGTTYEFQVSVTCASGSSGFNSSTDFTTASPCGVPSGLTTSGTAAATSATLTWTAVSGAATYTIQYRVVGTSTWSTTTSPTNTVTLTGLTPGTNYEYEVSTICSTTGTSVFSPSTIFSTSSNTGVTSTQNEGNSLQIFPNPAVQNATITYYLAAPHSITLAVYDLVGQEIMILAKNELQQEGAHRLTAELVNPGVYFIKFTIDNVTYTRKVVKL